MKRNPFNWNTLLLMIMMSGLIFTACDDEETEPDRSSDKTITSFTLPLTPPVAGTITGNDIAVTVPSGTDVTSLAPVIVVSDEASVSPASGTARDFTSPVTYTVTAEDGTTTDYTVTVTVTPAQSSAADITSFVLGGLTPPIDGVIDGTNITATVPARTDLTALVPTIVISENATIDPASGAAQDFSAPVTYTVTAEDGTTKAYTVTITEAASVQVAAVWEKNLNAGGLPTWFTANNERDIAAFGDFVYAHTNNDKIRILSSATGEEIDAMDFIDGTANPPTGTVFANLMGMDVDDEGNIVGSTLAAPNDDFRIYRWNDKDADQELLISGTFPARLGDNITVVGNVNDAAIIYAPGVGTDKIYKFTVVGGVGNNVPEEITVPTSLGNGADVYPINGEDGTNLIATGTGFGNIVELSKDDGSIVHQLPVSLKETADSTIFDALTAIAFEVNGRNIIAAASTDYTGTSTMGTLYFVDYTDGWNELTEQQITVIPFTPAGNIDANFNATGGLDVIVSEDGNEATVYGLITNFGIGAYKVTFE
ncbi:MAG: DUF5018 domain-containing protein [Tunicatimonas sp.]